MQVYTYMQVCKYASMLIYATVLENSLPYSNLFYPTYPTKKNEAIYMSAVASFLFRGISKVVTKLMFCDQLIPYLLIYMTFPL